MLSWDRSTTNHVSMETTNSTRLKILNGFCFQFRSTSTFVDCIFLPNHKNKLCVWNSTNKWLKVWDLINNICGGRQVLDFVVSSRVRSRDACIDSNNWTNYYATDFQQNHVMHQYVMIECHHNLIYLIKKQMSDKLQSI